MITTYFWLLLTRSVSFTQEARRKKNINLQLPQNYEIIIAKKQALLSQNSFERVLDLWLLLIDTGRWPILQIKRDVCKMNTKKKIAADFAIIF